MLRDRRTLIAMVVVPVLLYPALMLFAGQAAIVQMGKEKKQVSRVAVKAEQEADAKLVRQWLDQEKKIEWVTVKTPRKALLEGKVDVLIVVPADLQKQLDTGKSIHLSILYDATESRSRLACERMQYYLEKEQKRLLEKRLASRSIDLDYITPLLVDKDNVAPPAKVTGSLVGIILPILLVFMLGLGAVYPAMDLTAGERERGTLETLLSTPTAKIDIVAGKFLTVFCISMATGLLNLASVILTFVVFINQLPPQDIPMILHITPGMIAITALIMLPLAFFISAAVMALAAFARSFKEAQNYVMPFFILIAFPVSFAALPGVKLTGITQLIPVANAALLFKELLVGTMDLQHVFAVFISTAAWGCLVLFFAASLFHREDVLLSEEKEISFTLRRKDIPPREVPTPGMGLLAFAIALLLTIDVGSILQARYPLPGIVATQGLILFPALFLCWYARIDIWKTFSLRRPQWLLFPVILFMAPAAYLLVLLYSNWQQAFLPAPPELDAAMKSLIKEIQERFGMAGVLGILAGLPAICEELLFRGMILSSFRGHLRLPAGILLVGLLFGIMHLLIYRLIPITLAGTLFAYLVWRSRSIFTSMWAHFLFNSTALLLSAGAPGFLPVQPWLKQLEEGKISSVLLGGCALAVVLTGIGCIEWLTRRKEREI